MSFVILNCMDVGTARIGLQVLSATKEEVGDMLGKNIYVRVCTTCGSLETRIDDEDNFRLHSPEHPMAIKFRSIVNDYGDSPCSPWGLPLNEFPACHVIGAIRVGGFKTYGYVRMTCPGCGCSSL